MKSEFIKRIKYTIKPNKKISEISPINEFGINLIKERNANKIINQIVEEPLRKVCKELKNKGIETVMSSANKNNILKEGEKALEREDVERYFGKLTEKLQQQQIERSITSIEDERNI